MNKIAMSLSCLLIISLCLFSCKEPAAEPAPAEAIGYWHWTYHDSLAPEGTTMGIAFFGSVDPATAIEQSLKVKDRLKGDKYICLGGGNSSGKYTAEAIEKIIMAIQTGKFSGYQGIAFDVELGTSDLEDAFTKLFAITKMNHLKVLVTVSHSDPYGVGDKSTLMESFFADENIDILSPQLYTTGRETSNDYTAAGIQFSEYSKAKAAVVPSIVRAEYYPDAQAYFKKQGVELKGYIQWHQNSAPQP